MGIEFDPSTSTYYQTAYTGEAVSREPVENAPSEMDLVEMEKMQASPYPEEVAPPTDIYDPAYDTTSGNEPPPETDSMPNPYDPYVGSLVDTVV